MSPPRLACPHTFDIFAYQPPPVVKAYDEVKVRAASFKSRVAKAVSTTLKECGMTREEIAKKMTDYLGEEVSKAMLDAYASEARGEHNITLSRLMALIHVTKDLRIIQELVSPLGHVIVEEKWVHAINDAIYADRIKELEKQRKTENSKWKR